MQTRIVPAVTFSLIALATTAVGFTAGAVALVVGGIAGIHYGAERVPVEAEKPSLLPRIALGPRSGSLTWRF